MAHQDHCRVYISTVSYYCAFCMLRIHSFAPTTPGGILSPSGVSRDGHQHDRRTTPTSGQMGRWDLVAGSHSQLLDSHPERLIPSSLTARAQCVVCDHRRTGPFHPTSA